MSFPRILNNRFRQNRSNIFHVGPNNDYKTIEAALDTAITNVPKGSSVEIIIDGTLDNSAWVPNYTLPNTHIFSFRGSCYSGQTYSGGAVALDISNLEFEPYNAYTDEALPARLYIGVEFHNLRLGGGILIPTGIRCTFDGCSVLGADWVLSDTGVVYPDPPPFPFVPGNVCSLIINNCTTNGDTNFIVRKTVDGDLIEQYFGGIYINASTFLNASFSYETGPGVTGRSTGSDFVLNSSKIQSNIGDSESLFAFLDDAGFPSQPTAIRMYDSSLIVTPSATARVFEDRSYDIQLSNITLSEDAGEAGWLLGLTNFSLYSGVLTLEEIGTIPSDTTIPPRTRAAYEGTGDPNGNVTGVYPMFFLQTDGDPNPVLWQSIDSTANTNWAQISN